MRNLLVWSVAIAAASASFCQQTVWTAAMNLGFKGPVHAARSEYRKISDYPIKDGKLEYHLRRMQAVLEFDRAGNLTREAWDVGGPETATSHLPDRTVYETTDSDGKRHRSEVIRKTLPENWTEQVSIYDGKEMSRTRERRDCGSEDSESYDASGKLLSRSHTEWDPLERRREWHVWDGDGKTQVHYIDLRDPEKNTSSRTALDDSGKQVWNIVMTCDGNLVSWYHDPSCRCSGSLGVSKHNEATNSYEITEDGQLFHIEESHPARFGNIETDSVTLYDANERMLEKVTFEYLRDQRGNWTVRRGLAWDPSTNAMVPVFEETRKITYF